MSESIDRLIKAFTRLPGIGPKTAQRLVLHLLQKDRRSAAELSSALAAALERVRNCERCRDLTDGPVCRICADPRRRNGLLCVVESPADVLAMENSGVFGGQYHVLMGHLSPIDGVGPEDLGLDALVRRIDGGDYSELILALNANVESDATAHYIHEILKDRRLAITRLAQGLPVGGELEYVDGGTLRHALLGRQRVPQ
jgi:recombination protein RecR